jgi:hypothetical protein
MLLALGTEYLRYVVGSIGFCGFLLLLYFAYDIAKGGREYWPFVAAELILASLVGVVTYGLFFT